MKNFLRAHSYDAAKLLLTQIAISMFGFVLTMACGLIDSDSLRTGCSVFAILFYLFLVYTSIWDLGAKDAISVEYGHKEYRPLTGLWIALLANAINYLLAVGLLLGTLLPINNVGAISKIAALFMQGMYSGVLAIRVHALALNARILPYFLTPLPAIAAAAIAYYLGLKNKRFTRMQDWKTGRTTGNSKKNH